MHDCPLLAIVSIGILGSAKTKELIRHKCNLFKYLFYSYIYFEK